MPKLMCLMHDDDGDYYGLWNRISYKLKCKEIECYDKK
jgi:hypothetical protein